MDVEKRSEHPSAPYDTDSKQLTERATNLPIATAALRNSSAPNPQHALFCRMVGLPGDFETASYPSIWNVFSRKDKNYKGLYPRVRVAYQWHTFQYWLVACMANALLWIQICFGAILTALGGLRDTRVSVAIMVLGALQTIYAGLITYFKSRAQPNRARQFRNALKHVLDAINNAEELLRDPGYIPPPYRLPDKASNRPADTSNEEWLGRGAKDMVVTGVEAIVLRLMVMYTDAVKEAESNYPELWHTSKRVNDQDQVSKGMMENILDELRKNGAVKHGEDHTQSSSQAQVVDTTPSKETERHAVAAKEDGSTTASPKVHVSMPGERPGAVTGSDSV